MNLYGAFSACYRVKLFCQCCCLSAAVRFFDIAGIQYAGNQDFA